MKNSVYIALGVGLLLVTCIVAQGSSQSAENTNKTGKYSDIIDETIAKCRNKIALLNSKSPNAQRQAIRASLKGAYFQLHKNDLVYYLVTINAEASEDRIQYHLNKRFYQSLKPDELYVLLEASQMLNQSRQTKSILSGHLNSSIQDVKK